MKLELLEETEKEFLDTLIDKAEHIVVTGHKGPDGDAVGACIGWADYLITQRGKDVVIVMPDAFPNFLQWLPNIEKIVRFDKRREEAEELLQKADLLFCVDYNEPSRVDEMETTLLASKAKKVMLDHHLHPVTTGMELVISHPALSSASEVVFRTIWQLGGFPEMTHKGATALYCGMMTDTGGFTFNSNRSEIFFIICQLLTKGIDKDKIYRNVYNNYSAWAIRLRGYLLSEKMTYFDEYHAAYYVLTRKEMVRYHFVKGDVEGLVNEPLRIKGLKLSISLREDDRHDNLVWVSLRSVDDFPCNEMAKMFFNGVGHLNASGGRLMCSIVQAEKVVRNAISYYGKLLKENKNHHD